VATPFVAKKNTLKKENTCENVGENLSVSIPAHSVYHNITVKTNISLIKKELKGVGGIYAIVHNKPKKLYIGSSIDLAKRIMDHLNNKSSNIYLQHAIRKHGLNNFAVYILELLPTNTSLLSKELSVTLINMEQKNLDLFDDKYNINPLAGKTRLGAKHTEASKELMGK
jgi:predicted GIY-YIG superfamily endonuclease